VKERVGAPELLRVEPFPITLLIPARSTTSNEARVVFFGLKSPLSRSTRSSGTRATPECISARAPPNEEVATEAAGEEIEQRGFSALGKPDQADLHARSCYHTAFVPEHRPLDARGAALSLLLAALWGANPVAIKLGLADMPPLRLALMRFVLSAVVIFAYAMLTGRYDVLVIRPGEAKPIWSLGLLFVVQVALMNFGLERTTAAHGVIVLNSYAVHTVVFAHFLIPGDR
jgi:hypothetical protein